MPRIFIVSAPQGAGKTNYLPTLTYRLGITDIEDEWDGTSELKPGTLALTSLSSFRIQPGAVAISVSDEAGLETVIRMLRSGQPESESGAAEVSYLRIQALDPELLRDHVPVIAEGLRDPVSRAMAKQGERMLGEQNVEEAVHASLDLPNDID